MVGFFGALGVAGLAFWGIGAGSLLERGPNQPALSVPAFWDALKDVLSLSNLSSHGGRLPYPASEHSRCAGCFITSRFMGPAMLSHPPIAAIV